MPALEKYWYKARGVNLSGTVQDWEGSIWSRSGSALSTIRQRSLMWAAKEIYFIAVYEYDMDTGELDRSPVLWQSYADDGTPLPQGQLLLDAPVEEKSSYTYEPQVRTVITHYDDAEWTTEVDFPQCFVTLKPKEQSDGHEHNRG